MSRQCFYTDIRLAIVPVAGNNLNFLSWPVAAALAGHQCNRGTTSTVNCELGTKLTASFN